MLSAHQAFKQWASRFNGDSTITTAVLDRYLYPGHTVVLEGASYRINDRAETDAKPQDSEAGQ